MESAPGRPRRAGGTYLDRIVRSHRDRAGADRRPLEPRWAVVATLAPSRPFARAVRAAAGVSVVAEVKRRSPSRGDLSPDLDAGEVAAEYAAGGAACLSVLTDAEFFGGSEDDLRRARSAVALPVLRKDFTVCESDILDARIMGADAVLLIVAALGGDELASLLDVTRRVGMDALVEVHDLAELARALEAGAQLVGVNQRDLATFEVDHRRAAEMAEAIPPGVASVAESGIRGPEDVATVGTAGYDAVLVGETVVTATDRTAAVGRLVEAGRSARANSGRARRDADSVGSGAGAGGPLGAGR